MALNLIVIPSHLPPKFSHRAKWIFILWNVPPLKQEGWFIRPLVYPSVGLSVRRFVRPSVCRQLKKRVEKIKIAFLNIRSKDKLWCDSKNCSAARLFCCSAARLISCSAFLKFRWNSLVNFREGEPRKVDRGIWNILGNKRMTSRVNGKGL